MYFYAFLANPVRPMGPKCALGHLGRPWGGQKLCVFQHFWPPQWGPLAPRGPLATLAAPRVAKNLAIFSMFGHPSEPQGGQRGSLVALVAQKHTFSYVFRTRKRKLKQNTHFWHFDLPPKRALGARGKTLPGKQSKLLSWDVFWRADCFGKVVLVHKHRTHKNANPMHTYTQTTHRFASARIHTYTHTRKHTHRFASVRIHTYAHIHKHTNKPIVLPPCAYTYTLNFRPSRIYRV